MRRAGAFANMENGIDRLSTTDAENVALLFRQPGWGLFINYLKVKRRTAAAQVLYHLDVDRPSEMAEARGKIRLIDELLTETQNSRRMLASRMLDNVGQKSGAPYAAEDA